MLAKPKKMADRYFLFLAHKQGQGVVQKVGLAFDVTVELNNIICILTTWFLPFFLSPLPRPEILEKDPMNSVQTYLKFYQAGKIPS